MIQWVFNVRKIALFLTKIGIFARRFLNIYKISFFSQKKSRDSFFISSLKELLLLQNGNIPLKPLFVFFGIISISAVSIPLVSSYLSPGKSPPFNEKQISRAVLAASAIAPSLQGNIVFNIPAIFNDDVTLNKGLQTTGLTVEGDTTILGNLRVQGKTIDIGSGNVLASNVIYSLAAGSGISIGSGQNPTITNTGVTSFQGATGSITLSAGNGISLDGTKISNTDGGSAQNIFKNITVGSNTIAAGSNTDTLTFVAGTGVSLSADTTNKQLTINATGNLSGLTAYGILYATNSTTATTLTPGTSGYILSSNGSGSAPSWISSSSINYWQLNNSVLSPATITNQLALGQTTALANTALDAEVNGLGNSIAVFNQKGSGPILTASASGLPKFVVNSSGYLGIDGTSNPQYPIDVNNEGFYVNTNNDSYGRTFNALGFNYSFNSNWFVNFNQGQTSLPGILTINVPGGSQSTALGILDVREDATQISGFETKPVATISGQTSFAALVVDNGGVGDIFTASHSGQNRFVITQGGNVGIGTNSPFASLQISGNGTQDSLVFDQYGTGTDPDFIGRAARGTQNAPTAIQSGDRLLTIGARGYYTGSFAGLSNAAIQMYAAQNFTSSNQGSYMDFETTPLNSTSRTERLRIDTTGQIGINATAPQAILDVRGLGTNTMSGTIPIASISGKTAFAGLIVDNGGVGDIFTASTSGQSRFVITQAGNVGIGTTNPTASLMISNTAYTDNFNRTDSASLGSNWTKVTDAGTDFQIVSNQLKETSSDNSTSALGAYTSQGISGADYSVQSDIIFPSSSDDWLAVGGRESTNGGSDMNGYFVFASMAQQKVAIYKRNAGTWTQLGTAPSVTISSGTTYTMKLVMQGTNLYLYWNGSLKTSTTDSTFSSAGFAGIAVGNPNLSGSIWDNFTIYPSSPTINVNSNLAVNANGWIGIGTTTPSYGIDVQSGSVNDTGNLYVSGNIGLGTTAPAFGLDLQNSQASTVAAMLANTNTGASAAVLGLKIGANSAGTGNNFLTFLDGKGEIIGKVTGNASGGVTYATTGIDFAEYFKKDVAAEDLEPGTVVCQGSNGVTACQAGGHIIGVVSDRAGFAGGSEHANDPTYVLVGLIGQLPVKIASEASILSGDPLMVDSQGRATKASSTGQTIGTALQSSNQANNTTIMASINISWFDPNSTNSALISTSPSTNLLNNMQDIPLITAQEATISGTLNVLDKTTLTDVGITGTISDGLINIHGLEGKIDTLAGDLMLQSEGLGGINILNGLVMIDTSGNITTKGVLSAQTVSTEQLNVKGTKSIGSTTIPAGQITITIITPAMQPTSKVFLTPTTITDKELVITKKTNGAFTVTLSSPETKDISFDWLIIGNQ